MMNKAFLSFATLVFLASCDFKQQESTAPATPEIDKSPAAEPIKGIRFVVESARRPTLADSVKASAGLRSKGAVNVSELVYDRRSVKVHAALYNDNVDTAYFLSTSCDGIVYSLRYDADKFSVDPYIMCNAIWPIMLKIAPKEKHTFEARFICVNKQKTIRLGFDFYAVDKSFATGGKNPAQLRIFTRPENEQTISWADDTTIK